MEQRSKITQLYRELLIDVPGIRLAAPLPSNVRYNHSYMPIEVEEREFGMNRDTLYDRLKEWNVFTRRYFYPLICDFACYRSVSMNDPLTVARRVSDSILTLPIYESLPLSDVGTICEIIKSLHRNNT